MRISRTPWLALGAVLIASWLLFNLDLEGLSLWTDELIAAEWTYLSFPEIVQHTVADYHPPLYFLLLRLWTDYVGHSDFALRWFSVASGWLGVALLYRLGRAWGGRGVGWYSAALWGVSPLVMLYGRMARYYSLSALLGLLSTYALWYSLVRGKRRYWVAYTILAMANLYTFYLAGLLLPIQGWFALRLKGRLGAFHWLMSMLLVALGLLPWSGVISSQLVRTSSGAADLAYSLVGIMMKVAYPAYALALGESLFPWHPLAAVGGVAVLALFVLGVTWWRERGFLMLLLGLLLFPFTGMVLITTLVSPRTPFVSMPARAFFAAPYFFLILGGGFIRRSPPSLSSEEGRGQGEGGPRWLSLVALALAATWSLGLVNYYRHQQFLNPIYLTPAREMVSQVLGQLQPGDAIFSPDDSGFRYYYERSGAQAPHFCDPVQAIAHFESGEARRVWLVVLGRDQTRHSAPAGVHQWLQGHYSLVGVWGYVPQPPTYRALKSYLLGRPAYEHRATLYLYAQEGR